MDSGNLLLTVINTVFAILVYIPLLYALLQWGCVLARNPVAKIVIRIGSPIIRPMQHIIGTYKNINFSALLLALIVQAAQIICVVALVGHSFPDFGGLLLWAVLMLLERLCTLILYGTIIFALMSWFPNMMMSPLGQCIIMVINPIVSPFRRIIPQVAGLDFSAMALVFTIFIIRFLLAPVLAYAVTLALA